MKIGNRNKPFIDKSSHSPVAFAVTLSESLPESPTVGLTRELADWLEKNQEGEHWWKLRIVVAHTITSYFVCIVAMSLGGLLGFFLFRYLVLPAPRWRKTAFLLVFVTVSGLPAAIPGWLSSFLVAAPVSPYLSMVPALPRGYLDMLLVKLIIIFCLVVGDGLAGVMLLRARALTSDDDFETRMAAIWASTRLKNYVMPLPGTASFLVGKEMSRRTIASWSSLLSRFLVSEVALEFVLARLTSLPNSGIGYLLIKSIVEKSTPVEFGLTAVVLLLPLILLRTLTTTREKADVS